VAKLIVEDNYFSFSFLVAAIGIHNKPCEQLIRQWVVSSATLKTTALLFWLIKGGLYCLLLPFAMLNIILISIDLQLRAIRQDFLFGFDHMLKSTINLVWYVLETMVTSELIILFALRERFL